MTLGDIANLQRDFGLSFPADYISVVTGEVAKSLNAYSLEVAESTVRESNFGYLVCGLQPPKKMANNSLHPRTVSVLFEFNLPISPWMRYSFVGEKI
jgi:hypothetical protein